MIAETPYPATVSRRTRLIIHYHDAIPLLMPHTISDRRHHQAFHYHALRENVERGALFVCASEATRKDLLSIFPQAEGRSFRIHNMVSHHYFDEPSSPERVREIIQTRASSPKRLFAYRENKVKGNWYGECVDFLLVVSTIEPRKNHLTLLSAWEQLRGERMRSCKLVIVGTPGWHHDSIIHKFRPWLRRGEALMLEDVPSSELRLLYKHARATVCPSFAEGFDLPGVEAMMSGGAVVASDIPVHREVYADAAEYFNPYAVDDLVRALCKVIDPSHASRREELVSRGADVARRYAPECILPQWEKFLTSSLVVPA
jgi:glycosyltransferase involved in cell wall biosynthesis